MMAVTHLYKPTGGGGICTAQLTLLSRPGFPNLWTRSQMGLQIWFNGTCDLENINYLIHTNTNYIKAILQSWSFLPFTLGCFPVIYLESAEVRSLKIITNKTILFVYNIRNESYYQKLLESISFKSLH
jgi:hypothetical protein